MLQGERQQAMMLWWWCSLTDQAYITVHCNGLMVFAAHVVFQVPSMLQL